VKGKLKWLLLDLPRWFWDGWPGWSLIAVPVAIALAIWWATGNIEYRLRYTGMFLEIFGILTVAAGLRETRRLFKRPSLFEFLRGWIRRVPKWATKPHIIVASGIGSAGVGGSASGFGWQGLPPAATLDDRVSALEKNIESVKRIALDAQQQICTEALKWLSEMQEEKRVRDVSDRAIRDQLESFAVGNLNIESVGVGWLLFGVVLATTSQELTGLITRLS
jgi:hypothetical protein